MLEETSQTSSRPPSSDNPYRSSSCQEEVTDPDPDCPSEQTSSGEPSEAAHIFSHICPIEPVR